MSCSFAPPDPPQQRLSSAKGRAVHPRRGLAHCGLGLVDVPLVVRVLLPKSRGRSELAARVRGGRAGPAALAARWVFRTRRSRTRRSREEPRAKTPCPSSTCALCAGECFACRWSSPCFRSLRRARGADIRSGIKALVVYISGRPETLCDGRQPVVRMSGVWVCVHVVWVFFVCVICKP
jgi:hypothetical protein